MYFPLMEFNSPNDLGLFVPVFACPLLDRQQNFKKVHEIFKERARGIKKTAWKVFQAVF